ncbi:MAG: glycosyltransferase [Planctomycetota bacterium]
MPETQSHIGSEVSIAVCICTMSRPEDLQKAMRALADCSPRPEEIIVSDDSPDDDRRSEELCTTFERARYTRGPRRGLSANRNHAISIATSTWLHFIDDDVIVAENFYGLARRLIERLEQPALICGRERKYASATDEPEVVVPIHCGLWAHMEPATDGNANCTVINATLFPSELFASAAFDERFRYGCEEADITQQAIRLGYPLTEAPSLMVDHYPSQTNRSTYTAWQGASVVYAGLKRHYAYTSSPSKLFVFVTAGLARLLAHRTRHDGLPGAMQCLRGIGIGFKHFASYLFTRSARVRSR